MLGGNTVGRGGLVGVVLGGGCITGGIKGSFGVGVVGRQMRC